jgi:FkbM family methyltransferase
MFSLACGPLPFQTSDPADFRYHDYKALLLQTQCRSYCGIPFPVQNAFPIMMKKPSLVDRFFRSYGKTRLRGFIQLWRLSGRGSYTTLRAKTSKGTVFELSPFSYIDAIVLQEGYYESEVVDAIVSSLGDGVLWDVGANFGLHGLTAKFLRPSARVVCFEPSVEMVGRLLRNRALNALDVDVVNVALSNRSGFLRLFLGPPGNPGMSTLSPVSEATYAGTSIVAISRGDDLVAQGLVPAPTVIKLDVEGHELLVLEGLFKVLHSPSLKALVIEDSPADDTPVKALLSEAGFTCESLSRRENSEHRLANFVARRN